MSDLNKIEVVPVVLEKHPDADSLSVVRIEGYTCVVRTTDWEGITKAAYLPPDSVVPGDRPEFAFLDGKFRIKAKKLRGIMSQGLLVPVPDNFQIGDDVTEYFGVTRYIPPADVEGPGNICYGPPDRGVKYDIDCWFKYKKLMIPGECCVMTEKIHGTNARYTFQDDKMWAASRTLYRTDTAGSTYWRVANQNPQIEEFCRAYPGTILYGEIFGWVQHLRYGANPGQLWFRAFDVYERGAYWSYGKFEQEMSRYGIEIVPTVYLGPYSDEKVLEVMSGKSTIANNIREGVVIRLFYERYDPENRLGRIIMKAVSPEYLEKSK
jgi:RNA ligase (TIGR02306 family)